MSSSSLRDDVSEVDHISMNRDTNKDARATEPFSPLRTLRSKEEPDKSTGGISRHREKEASSDGKKDEDSVCSNNLSEVLKARGDSSKEKEVSIVLCNVGYAEICNNLLHSMKMVSLSNYFVIALDGAMAHWLQQNKIPCYYKQGTEEVAQYVTHNTEQFNKITRLKPYYVLEIIKLGYNVLLLDADVVLIRNPFDYFHSKPRYSEYDFFIQQDDVNIPNSGFYFMRSRSNTINFMTVRVPSSFFPLFPPLTYTTPIQLIFSASSCDVKNKKRNGLRPPLHKTGREETKTSCTALWHCGKRKQRRTVPTC